MRSLFIVFFLIISTSIFSQKLVEVNGKYQSRVEYSVSGRDLPTIFRKCNIFLDMELPNRKTLSISQDDKINKFSGIGTWKKFQFVYEVICTKESFKMIFTNISYKSKPINQKLGKIDDINQFFVDLCGKMQSFVRYS